MIHHTAGRIFEEKRITATDAIEALPYKAELKRLLVRYTLALDQANLDVTFLMLWGLLEKITDSVGNNYDLTVQRAVWGYRDRAIAKEMLNQMRWRRNRFVHAGSSTADRDQLCYITKSFVDSHLVYLIRDTYKLNSIKEYAEFLSLPNSKERLMQMQEWYKTALELFPIPKPDAEKHELSRSDPGQMSTKTAVRTAHKSPLLQFSRNELC